MSWYLLAAIPVFALLVLIHEFGHFITAKWAGIRVEEFAIGFPPRLFSIKRGETTYSINLLPIGGFVRMPGENGDVNDENGHYDPHSFAVKPASKRAIVLVAGVTMNLLLAWVLFTAAELVGQVQFRPVAGQVVAGQAASQAGMKSGDKIITIDGQSVTYFTDVTRIVTNLTNDVPASTATVPINVVVVHPDSSEQVTLHINALAHPDAKKGQGHLGITADQNNPYITRVPIWEAPVQGVRDIGDVIGATVGAVQMIIKGVIPLGDAVGGPVAIVSTTGQIAQEVPVIGPYLLLYWTAALSLNLAFVNILPIPALDGGRLLFIGIEVLRRGRRISPEREALVNLIGMGALLFLMLLVTFNDIGNIAGGH